MSESKKGKRFTDEHRRKLSESHKGYKIPELTKAKMSQVAQERLKDPRNHSMFGKKQTIEARRKIADSHRGEKSHLWRGGTTSQKKQIMQSLEYVQWRSSIFERDNYTCRKCGAYLLDESGDKVRLEAHHMIPAWDLLAHGFTQYLTHIDNGLTLCSDCHHKITSLQISKYRRLLTKRTPSGWRQ
jgi:5-methylcytosine-specific restriction endonuclease McrA